MSLISILQFLGTFKGSLELGIIFAVMALGVFISFRTLNMPDLTVDGSYTLGAAVSAVLCSSGHPLLGLAVAFVAGCAAGSVTALLTTKLKIQPLLSGILMMLALYSINLKVMGKANIPLLNKPKIYNVFSETSFKQYAAIIISLVILAAMLFLLYCFLKTKFGFVLRATGDNDKMVRALGVNTDFTILVGLAISNGLVALCGAMIAQYQSFADIGMGIGMVIIGLASVIIGEVIGGAICEFIFGRFTLIMRLSSVIFGAILYRLVIAVALELGMPPTDLKLVSAVIVAAALSMTVIKGNLTMLGRKHASLNGDKGGRI